MNIKTSSPTVIPDSINTKLRDGTNICLRPIRADDEEQIEKGIKEMSDRSRYLRFFSGFKEAPPSVVKRLADVDGICHLAWGIVNLDLDNSPAFAAAHIIRDESEGDCSESDCGEFAIAVLDEYQGRGASRLLMASIFAHALDENIARLRMDMLSENAKALRLILELGASLIGREGPVMHYELNVSVALEKLRELGHSESIQKVLSDFGM